MKKTNANIVKKDLKDTSLSQNTANVSAPPSRIKIIAALKSLLKDKDFNSITTAEISRVAGVNEALIYRHFDGKRGLLHTVLSEYLNEFISNLIFDLKGIKGAVNKIRKFVWATLHYYDDDRVFSQILLLEVRNFPGYFESETYQIIKQYTDFLMKIIEEGIQSGEMRDDIDPSSIRQFILGSIEHYCLPALIFNHKMDCDILADNLCEILFVGILKK